MAGYSDEGEPSLAIDIAHQTQVFIYACLLGAGIGFVYDIFRVMRIAFNSNSVVIFLQDILFCLVVTAASAWYLLYENMGKIRMFIILGEVLGWIIYYFTIGDIVIKFSEKIINILKRILGVITKWVFMPLIRILCSILRLFAVPFKFIFKIATKLAIIMNFRLKRRYIMMYNLNNNPNMRSDERSSVKSEKNKKCKS